MRLLFQMVAEQGDPARLLLHVLGFHPLKESLDLPVIRVIAWNGPAEATRRRDGLCDFMDRSASGVGRTSRRSPGNVTIAACSPRTEATPLPMPRLAPVTTATLPAKEGKLLMILACKFLDEVGRPLTASVMAG